MTQICDYEGSRYRTEFWENENRAYEDGVERVAIQAMLPPKGKRILDIGAGYGRLVDLYDGYEQVIILDYARTQVEEAQRYLGRDDRFVYVVGNIYSLPFVDNLLDTLITVRVMHHLTDVPQALAEIQRVLQAKGVCVVEHANKQNLKAIGRWLLRRQTWNPFESSPIEFVELNFNFHPKWMRQQLAQAGLSVRDCRTLSHYRIDFLKRSMPTDWLIRLDAWAQLTGNHWQLTPSVMLKAQAKKATRKAAVGFFRCPQCFTGNMYLTEEATGNGQMFVCQTCHVGWSVREGIYDFKNPVQL